MATSIKKGLSALTFGLFMLGLVFTSQAGEIDPPKNEKKAVKTKVTSPDKKIQTTEWFVYNGPNQTRSAVENPENYSPHNPSETPAPTCISGSQLCALNANNDGNDQPELTSAFVDEVMAAISAQGTPSNSNIKLRN